MSTIKDDLKNITFNREDTFENMTEEEKKILLADCSIIFKNESFKKIIDELGTFFIIKSAIGSSDMDEVSYFRGIIHGVNLVYETIQAHNQEYIASLQKEEKYDPQEII